MTYSLTHAALMMAMLGVVIAPTPRSDRALACLPGGIKPDLIVSTESVRSKRGVTVKTTTVDQTLMKLKARCKKGKLVDGKGRGIYFFRMIGCWGNPPADYQELLEKQKNELTRLKKSYTVIEIPCNQGGDPRKIS